MSQSCRFGLAPVLSCGAFSCARKGREENYALGFSSQPDAGSDAKYFEVEKMLHLRHDAFWR